jgi:glycosyltransferase involved in cell wall biosynthesis
MTDDRPESASAGRTVSGPASLEFQAYLRARDAVLRMKAQGEDAAASAYWTQELESIDYMIEASPLIVRRLRHHAFHVTGVRPYDYRDNGKREHFASRLEALRALGGDALLVPESPALGGFGFDIDGRLYNVDTLKFYEVLIGMQRGGVLTALRGSDRPLVCEIGAGWGGFAYQFKTLFPASTYVVVDFPEMFLFSATYLGATFPAARLLFADGDDPAAIDDWRDVDFVFVPVTQSHRLARLPLDLAVNMVSFQEMTDAQVRGYAATLAQAGCPLLYSLNRERSQYNTELVGVSEALADWYRLTEVAILETDYTTSMKKPPKAVRMAPASEPVYRHLVGRLDPAAHVAIDRAPQRTTVSATQSRPTASPRVVLGMTLYNNARHLPQALESLLAQTYGDFALVMLDDASTDASQAIAKQYVARDPRLHYSRHTERQAMIGTWREVAETAAREWPAAEYFAWVSDHDRWHPRWLERLIAELEGDRDAVLAYPITRRVSDEGVELEKGPRLFDTAGADDLHARWTQFCHDGVGAGDMVYGLVRLDALRRAGVFRPVLRPDRLLVAELTLQGRIRQVPEVLWFRRQSSGTSVSRQHSTLMLAGTEPRWFFWPPWLQHTLVLWREYASREPRPLPLTRAQWARMLLRYQVTYGWRHFRKSDTSHGLARGVNNAIWAKKQVRHHYHHGVYNTLVGARALRGRLKRAGRRVVYELLMLTHRLGLRGRGESSSQ